jgi:hypothetical protein
MVSELFNFSYAAVFGKVHEYAHNYIHAVYFMIHDCRIGYNKMLRMFK